VAHQRGQDYDMTKKKDSGPISVAELLKKFLDKSGIGEQIEAASVVPEWAERVGPAIAAVTTPMRVSQGTLIVGVRSSAWMNELKMMEREIISRINQGRTRGRIDKIRFQMI
jgi:predicted nucleic acid-binding Zn ribbon protein